MSVATPPPTGTPAAPVGLATPPSVLTPRPAGPGDDITISGLTWPKLFTILGGIGVIVVAAFSVLVNLLYGGLNSRFDRLEAQLQNLDTNYKSAVTAAVSVQDLLSKAPRLEQSITDISSDMKVLNGRIDTVLQSQQMEATRIESLRQDLYNFEFRVSAPPALATVPPGHKPPHS
jgi:hypothetical protein